VRTRTATLPRAARSAPTGRTIMPSGDRVGISSVETNQAETIWGNAGLPYESSSTWSRFYPSRDLGEVVAAQLIFSGLALEA